MAEWFKKIENEHQLVQVEPSLESLGVDRVGCLRSVRGGPLPMFSHICGSRYQALVEMHGSNLGIALRTAAIEDLEKLWKKQSVS